MTPLKLRRLPDSPRVFSVLATYEGTDLHVGAIIQHDAVYPPIWMWSINFMTRPTLPAPITGHEPSREEAMAAFRKRWDEIAPQISATDWAYKRGSTPATAAAADKLEKL